MSPFTIIASLILCVVVLRISYLMVVDVRKRDWNNLAIHSVQITACGLGLILLEAMS